MKLYVGEDEITSVGFHVTAGDIKDATTEPEEVLSGNVFYNNDGRKEGTMPNRGAVSASLNAGASYTIPEGYHDGAGKVAANSLASQVSEANFGNATAADVASGKTFTSSAGLKVAGTRTATTSDFDDIRMEEEKMLDLTGYTFKGYTSNTWYQTGTINPVILVNLSDSNAYFKGATTTSGSPTGQGTEILAIRAGEAIKIISPYNYIGNGNSSAQAVAVWVRN